MTAPARPFVNVFDAPVGAEQKHGEHFHVRMAPIAGSLGAKDIGVNLTRVPPGKAGFPFHHHHGNEEHFYIVRGTGTLRYGNDTYVVSPGDYVVHPAGGPERAHQLINTGSEELVYLAISTLRYPEVVGYPDSRKTGVRVPVASPTDTARFVIDDAARDAVGYYDREDGARVRAIVDSATKDSTAPGKKGS
jgi:uncharacterized cupin superfamily protein